MRNRRIKPWGNILILCLGLSGACFSMADDITEINQAALLQQLESAQNR